VSGSGRSLSVVESPGGGPRGIPGHVLSHASGGRDLWSPPRSEPPENPEEAVRDLLHEVLDPELPVSIVDRGLVYGTEVEEKRARVWLTFTATACPCMDFIEEDVRDRLLREPWLEEVDVERVWDPPWTRDRITARGRERLKRLGVGTR